MERRVYTAEIRAEEGETGPRLDGYAAVFDQESALLYGQFRERIERGAFAGSIGGDVRALWNHNPDFPLGRTTAGTLGLAEDAHGLRVEIAPPNTQIGRDAMESIRRGDVDQMSFAFDVLEDTWDQADDGVLIRTLRKVRLWEVSPVTFPAYPQTSISVRGGDAALGDMPEIPERFRRAAESAGAGSEEAAPQARAAYRERALRIAQIL